MLEDEKKILNEEIAVIEKPLKRVAIRFMLLMAISIVSFLALDILVTYDRGGFISRFPEVLQMLRASAAIGFLEGVVLMVRVILQPLVDVQHAVKKAEETPISAAIIYTGNQLFILIRVVILLFICDLI